MTNTRPVLNLQSAIGYVKDNLVYLKEPWNSFFQQFVQKAPAVVNVTVTASPFSYTPNQNGIVIVSGGTISAIALIRGTTTISLGTTTPKIIPVAISDTVKVTYSVLPTIQFLGS